MSIETFENIHRLHSIPQIIDNEIGESISTYGQEKYVYVPICGMKSSMMAIYRSKENQNISYLNFPVPISDSKAHAHFKNSIVRVPTKSNVLSN